jgi:hypothetical protein
MTDVKFVCILLCILLCLSQVCYGQIIPHNNDTILIETYAQLKTLEGVEVLNKSLFIVGGNNIIDLKPLRSLRVIGGYLVIWRSPALSSLNDLYQLQSIDGNPLYLSQSLSVLIENNKNQSNGMCFADTVDWGQITSHQTSVYDNGQNCPSCNTECIGCWGVSPRLCQQCQHFKSGVTCVSSCPNGTIQINKTCIEFIPNSPLLNGVAINYSSIEISWQNMESPNGVILGYRLNMNGTTVHYKIIDDYLVGNGLTESPELETNTTIIDLEFNSVYSFQIQSMTSVGWSNYSLPIVVRTHDGIPSSPTNQTVIVINASSAFLKWTLPIFPAGEIKAYQINVSGENGFSDLIIVSSNVTNYYLTELMPNTSYSFNIVATNRFYDSHFTNTIEFVTPYSYPNSPVVNISDITPFDTTITWQDTGTDFYQIDMYETRLYSSSNSSIDMLVQMFRKNITEYVADGLSPYTNYTFDIRGYNAYGYTNWTQISWQTLVTNPPIPRIPEVSEVTSTDIIFEVFPVSSINGQISYYQFIIERTSGNINTSNLENYTIMMYDVSQYVSLQNLTSICANESYRVALTAVVSFGSQLLMSQSNFTSNYQINEPRDKSSGWYIYLIIAIAVTGVCVGFALRVGRRRINAHVRTNAVKDVLENGNTVHANPIYREPSQPHTPVSNPMYYATGNSLNGSVNFSPYNTLNGIPNPKKKNTTVYNHLQRFPTIRESPETDNLPYVYDTNEDYYDEPRKTYPSTSFPNMVESNQSSYFIPPPPPLPNATDIIEATKKMNQVKLECGVTSSDHIVAKPRHEPSHYVFTDELKQALKNKNTMNTDNNDDHPTSSLSRFHPPDMIPINTLTQHPYENYK